MRIEASGVDNLITYINRSCLFDNASRNDILKTVLTS
jgi:hypothetical protein